MFKELSRIFASPSRLKLLKFFALQPAVKTTSLAASSALGMTRANTETELRSLVKVGIIQKKTQGKKVFYMFSSAHQYAEPLRAFLESTTLPTDKVIADAFRGVTGITLLAATGVLTKDTRPSLDLLVISRRPKNPGIARAVRKIETGTALSLRYAVLEAGDYKNRLETRDRLLRDVFDFSHRVILGRV